MFQENSVQISTKKHRHLTLNNNIQRNGNGHQRLPPHPQIPGDSTFQFHPTFKDSMMPIFYKMLQKETKRESYPHNFMLQV